jgi:hypothetical protein
MKKQTFESMIEQAQVLRNEALKAQTRLHLFLMEDGGFNTFASLIRQYKLSRPETYAEFKESTSKVSVEDIEVIGLSATIEASKIVSIKARSAYVAEARLRVEQEGFPWSREQAERARQRISPDGSKPLVRLARQSRLEQELAEAEKLIRTLKERVKQLEQENAKLKGKLVGRQPASLRS